MKVPRNLNGITIEDLCKDFVIGNTYFGIGHSAGYFDVAYLIGLDFKRGACSEVTYLSHSVISGLSNLFRAAFSRNCVAASYGEDEGGILKGQKVG